MLNPEIRKVLTKTQPFKYLESHELDMIINFSRLLTIPDKGIILQQGKINEGMYIIVAGKAVMVARTLFKEAILLATLEPGGFVGEVSLIEKGISPASVIAVEEVQCLLISTSYFEMLAVFFPETKFRITKAITEEVCDLIKDLYDKICVFMAQITMHSRPFFSEMMRTFTKTKIITFEEAHIDLNQVRRIDFFQIFTDDEYADLLTHSVLVEANRQCNLIPAGEKNPVFYILLRGAVMTHINQHNKVAKLNVIGPMALFANMAFINQEPALVSYTACERSILLKITPEDLLVFKNNHIQLWYKMYYLICQSFVVLERSAGELNIRLNSEFYNR